MSEVESGVPQQGALHGGSYKDKVMEIDSHFNFQPEEIVKMFTEELFPDVDHASNNENIRKEFNPNPTVNVELEEYEQWCNPWKYNLVVKLMGKRVGLRSMSSKLKFLWAKKGEIKDSPSISQLNKQVEGTIVQDPMNSENMECNIVSNPKSEQKSDPSLLNKIENNSIRKETSASRFDALQNIPEDYDESTIKKEKITSSSSIQKSLKAGPSKGKSNSSKMINSQPNPQKKSNYSQNDQQKKELLSSKGNSNQQDFSEKEDPKFEEPKNKEKNDWEREIMTMMSSMDKNNFLETLYGGSVSTSGIWGFVGQPEPENPPDPHLGTIQPSHQESSDRKIPVEGPLTNQSILPREEVHTFLTIDELSENGNWKTNSLQEILPSEIIYKLHVVSPHRAYLEEDTPTWAGSADGEFQMKMMYEIIGNL
ncbi:hypothetical protein SESBI_03236 [Sesbania bispinosa]|nr:hypothetical protein SESBI_03236 [Sesbania bispinosa]